MSTAYAKPVVVGGPRGVENYFDDETALIKRLSSIMYFTPMANCNFILDDIYEYIKQHKFPNYFVLLDKAEYEFDEYSGAILVAACMLELIERGNKRANMFDSNEDVMEYKRKMNPVAKLFTASGGRPNVEVTIKFNYGQTSTPAFGWSLGEEEEEDEEEDDEYSEDGWYFMSIIEHILHYGPPKMSHHVPMHEEFLDKPFIPQIIVKTRAYPPSTTSRTEDFDGVAGREGGAETISEVVPPPPPPEPAARTNKYKIADATVYCIISVYMQREEDIKELIKYVNADPAPLLLNAISRGSSIR